MNKVRMAVGGAWMFALILIVGGGYGQTKKQSAAKQPAANPAGATFTDSRDGKVYRTVKIGEQVWMAENLNYKTDGSKCYDEGGKDATALNVVRTAEEVQKSCDTYGRLYRWDIVVTVCPKGWHLPDNAEWDKLVRFADGTSGTESPYTSKTAGRYLKAASGWGHRGGEDHYGFAGLPGGMGLSSGNCGSYGNWWSATPSEYDSNEAHSRSFPESNDYANAEDDDPKGNFYSVRCIADAGQSSAPLLA